MFVVVVNVLGLALALGLNRAVKTRNLLRSLFFAPVVVSPLAVAYIWQCIFDYEGALNRFLGGVGLESWQRAWLGDPTGRSGRSSSCCLAVHRSDDGDLPRRAAGDLGRAHEATLVDGASSWLRLRGRLPLLAPAITVSATLTLIIGLRVFDQVMALTGGGPVDATETLATRSTSRRSSRPVRLRRRARAHPDGADRRARADPAHHPAPGTRSGSDGARPLHSQNALRELALMLVAAVYLPAVLPPDRDLRSKTNRADLQDAARRSRGRRTSTTSREAWSSRRTRRSRATRS